MKKISRKYRYKTTYFYIFHFNLVSWELFMLEIALDSLGQGANVCSATYYRSHNANLARA